MGGETARARPLEVPLRRFHRSGYGPGEFQQPRYMGFAGGRLWVADGALFRLSWLDLQGSLLRTSLFSSPAPPPFLPAVPRAILDDGTTIVEMRVPAVMLADSFAQVPIARIRASGEMIDTLFWIRLDHMARLSLRGTALVINPFVPRPIWRISPDGQVGVLVNVAASDASPPTFSIEWFDPRTGRSVRVRRYRYQAEPFDPDIVRRRLRSMAQGFSRSVGFTPEKIEEILWEGLERPDAAPPVYDVVLSTEHRILLRREQDSRDGAARWLVLSASGDLEGYFSAPEALDIEVFAGDRVFGIRRDALGVQYVKGYQLRASARAGVFD